MSSPSRSRESISTYYTMLKANLQFITSHWRLHTNSSKFAKLQLARKEYLVVTHDGRTICYPDPLIRVNDTVKFDFEQGKITDYVKFDSGNIMMITGGRNMGRAGVIVHREKHIGGFDIVHASTCITHECLLLP
jgi:ribosomal protein S4E